ncbi:MAG: bifunctional riboflavin kinase/FAD synthetase [Cyclobacteriaceae bacterium]|nr:bifunctional riboflavin kinase/FAD synthetase [Cyclobacteriaceae bacterium]
MKVYYHPDDFSPIPFAVVTSGTFDGVHLGHQKILNRVKEIARAHQGETVVITFWPHPRLVLHPEDTSLKLLNTFEEKAELLKLAGIDHLVRIPFTREFSQLSSEEFISRILVKTIGTRKLVIGYDHRFGHNREGSFEELRKNAPRYGFEVEEIPPQDVDHITVSSTKIRRSLEQGDVETANHLLGRPYSIRGQVIKGDRLGRLIGFPTANISMDTHYKLIPADGVYAVTVQHEGKMFRGMMYIGFRPTVGGMHKAIEVNLFDFDREIYGDELIVHFHARLRADNKFSDLDELKQQLIRDKGKAEEYLKNIRISHG